MEIRNDNRFQSIPYSKYSPKAPRTGRDGQKGVLFGQEDVPEQSKSVLQVYQWDELYDKIIKSGGWKREKIQKTESQEPDNQKVDQEEDEETGNTDITKPDKGETDSNIVTKPDGTRVLVIKVRTGGMEHQLSIKLSDKMQDGDLLNLASCTESDGIDHTGRDKEDNQTN